MIKISTYVKYAKILYCTMMYVLCYVLKTTVSAKTAEVGVPTFRSSFCIQYCPLNRTKVLSHIVSFNFIIHLFMSISFL